MGYVIHVSFIPLLPLYSSDILTPYSIPYLSISYVHLSFTTVELRGLYSNPIGRTYTPIPTLDYTRAS